MSIAPGARNTQGAAGLRMQDGSSLLELKNPRSVAIYDKYSEAQQAVDSLSDQEFDVRSLVIVGRDLKQVERVTGRLSWPTVLLSGAASGIWFGLFVGLVMALFAEGGLLTIVATTAGAGAVFGLVWAAIGYAMTQGRRDFTSVTAVVATRYEVLAEHGEADRARDLLGIRPERVEPEGPKRTYGEAIDEARRERTEPQTP